MVRSGWGREKGSYVPICHLYTKNGSAIGVLDMPGSRRYAEYAVFSCSLIYLSLLDCATRGIHFDFFYRLDHHGPPT